MALGLVKKYVKTVSNLPISKLYKTLNLKSRKMVTEVYANLIIPGLLGLVGGATRGVVGLLKAMSLRRKIIWSYWLITAVVAIIIGIFTALVFNFDWRLALLAGYAGTDILEGLYKSFQVQKVYIKK